MAAGKGNKMNKDKAKNKAKKTKGKSDMAGKKKPPFGKKAKDM